MYTSGTSGAASGIPGSTKTASPCASPLSSISPNMMIKSLPSSTISGQEHAILSKNFVNARIEPDTPPGACMRSPSAVACTVGDSQSTSVSSSVFTSSGVESVTSVRSLSPTATSGRQKRLRSQIVAKSHSYDSNDRERHTEERKKRSHNGDKPARNGLDSWSSEEKRRLDHIYSHLEGVPPLSASEFESDLEKEAWELLRSSVVTYCGNPVGTIAAQDPSMDECPVNYDQVFIRDCIPSAIAFMLKGETQIVREFLLNTLQLQSWEKTVDCFIPGEGLMPASFKVRKESHPGHDGDHTRDVLDADFGEAAIGRVAPVDSDGFDMFPTLLVTDGSCMIDRRMGIHGHPLEIQALFYSALRCAREMLVEEDSSAGLTSSINSRLSALLFHVREYYWLDLEKLNEIYRYNTEEYSYDAVNKFNIYPDQIPSWLLGWIPDQGGYLIGNLQPAHMDFRFFSLGNFWSIVGSLSNEEQSTAILDLIEARWDDFVGHMPFKIAFPALDGEEWRITTGADPKNTPWSYHNSGSWPVLLWQFTVACIKMGRQDLAQRAINVAEQKLSKDKWPEYYDTKLGRLIGKQARLQQTWTIAGFLVSKMLLKNPEAAHILTCDEDQTLLSTPIEIATKRRKAKDVLV